MSSILAKIFGKSPFEPLYQHMLKVNECVSLVKPLMEALLADEQEKVKAIAEKIFKAEHEADLVKKEIRNNLPRGIFLPVDRGDMLNYLREQDKIADSAEDLAVLVTLRKMKVPEELRENLKILVEKVLLTCETAMKVSSEIKLLAETSFGGAEAQKVMETIEDLKLNEFEADKAQMKLAQKMFSIEAKLDPVSIFMWMQVFKELGALANHAENLGDNLRMMLHKS
ncbi:MAG: TIGR00153 family protein [Candidatus Aminicenantes bacterium]|nr:TIGR00153 family protein [Candidatus Aminicenantes bacterium]